MRPNRAGPLLRPGARSPSPSGARHSLGIFAAGALTLLLAFGGCASIATESPASPSATGSVAPISTGTPSVAPSATESPSPTPIAYPLTLTDDTGQTVTLAAAPSHIVSLTPATTELIYALGADGRLIADTSFDDYPAEAATLPHVATPSSVDVEKIVGLGADLVIAGGNGFNQPAALERLRSLNIPVLVVYAKDVAGVLADIRLVGTAIGVGPAAADMAARMRSQIDAIAAATRSLDHPRTFYELDATRDIVGPADDSFAAEMVTLAGGTPITTGNTAVSSIPLETLVAADPQVIVLGDANDGTTPSDVAKRPGWGGMTAVRNGAIRPVDDTVVTRPGPRLVEGLRDLALAIHPDLALPIAP